MAPGLGPQRLIVAIAVAVAVCTVVSPRYSFCPPIMALKQRSGQGHYAPLAMVVRHARIQRGVVVGALRLAATTTLFRRQQELAR